MPLRSIRTTLSRWTRADWAVLAFIALLVLARSMGRALHVDVGLDDESVYLQSGVNLLRDGLPSGDWGPLYAVWYWVESLFLRDRVTLYYLNWSILLFAELLATFLVLRALQVGPLVQVATLSLLSASHLVESWPYVSVLGAALVAVAVAVALGGKSLFAALSSASAVLALVSFVRPEFTVSFAMLLVGSAISGLVERASLRALALRVGAPLLLFGALVLASGYPLGGDGRSFMAFGQHFSLNLVRAQQLPIDPWNEWPDIVRQNFGTASTVGEAIRANPAAFLWHVGENVRGVSRTLRLLSPPLPTDALEERVGAGVAVLLAVGVLLFAVRFVRAMRAGAGPERLRAGVLAAVAAAVLAPICASILIIQPRQHYVAAPFAALLALALWGWDPVLGFLGRRSRLARFETKAALALACAVLLTLPSRALSEPWYLAPFLRKDARPPPALAVIRTLQRVWSPGEREVVVLEAQWGHALYAGWNFRRLAQTECKPFEACIRRERPDVVIADGDLALYYQASDPGFMRFVANPQAFGYRPFFVPNAYNEPLVVMVRER